MKFCLQVNTKTNLFVLGTTKFDCMKFKKNTHSIQHHLSMCLFLVWIAGIKYDCINITSTNHPGENTKSYMNLTLRNLKWVLPKFSKKIYVKFYTILKATTFKCNDTYYSLHYRTSKGESYGICACTCGWHYCNFRFLCHLIGKLIYIVILL